MIEADKKLINEFAQSLVDWLKANTPRVSGRTADSIEYVGKDNGFIVQANASIGALIEGRKPTSEGASEGSGGTLQEKLLEWINAKGIVAKAMPSGKIPTSEQLSWAMAKSMHAKGNLLYQRGGVNNLLDGLKLQERLNAFTGIFTNDLSSRTINDLISAYKQPAQ